MNTVNVENKDLPAFACVGYDALGGNFKQPLLNIPHVSVSFLSVGGAKLKQNGKFNR